MRNILVYIPKNEKQRFADSLKLIWLAGSHGEAKRISKDLIDQYHSRFPKAMEILEEELEDSLSFSVFPDLDARKIISTNLLERLN